MTYVEKVIKDNDLSDGQLESFADYLLTSTDIQSNRKIDYKFWLNDNQFKQYCEHKNVMLADSMVIEAVDSSNSIIDIVSYKNEPDNEITNEYIDSIFSNVSSPAEVKRILKSYYYIEKNNNNFRISIHIDNIVGKVLNSLEFGRDLLIINWLLNGESQKDIADKLGISEATVHKRLRKISEKSMRFMV